MANNSSALKQSSHFTLERVSPVENQALSDNQLLPNPVQSSQSLNRALSVTLRTFIDSRALDPRAINVSSISDIADIYALCSATSHRHSQGIAQNIVRNLALVGINPERTVGIDGGNWIILDYGDLIVHILHHEARQFYNLDELWSKGFPISLPSELEPQAKLLRTGMYL